MITMIIKIRMIFYNHNKNHDDNDNDNEDYYYHKNRNDDNNNDRTERADASIDQEIMRPKIQKEASFSKLERFIAPREKISSLGKKREKNLKKRG